MFQKKWKKLLSRPKSTLARGVWSFAAKSFASTRFLRTPSISVICSKTICSSQLQQPFAAKIGHLQQNYLQQSFAATICSKNRTFAAKPFAAAICSKNRTFAATTPKKNRKNTRNFEKIHNF